MSRDWTAKWIGPEPNDSIQPVICKDFFIDDPIKKATLYITGTGLFEAYVNGQRVGEEYLTPYPKHGGESIQYFSFDVSELLNSGPDSEVNTVDVFMGKGWDQDDVPYALKAEFEIEVFKRGGYNDPEEAYDDLMDDDFLEDMSSEEDDFAEYTEEGERIELLAMRGARRVKSVQKPFELDDLDDLDAFLTGVIDEPEEASAETIPESEPLKTESPARQRKLSFFTMTAEPDLPKEEKKQESLKDEVPDSFTESEPEAESENTAGDGELEIFDFEDWDEAEAGSKTIEDAPESVPEETEAEEFEPEEFVPEEFEADESEPAGSEPEEFESEEFGPEEFESEEFGPEESEPEEFEAEELEAEESEPEEFVPEEFEPAESEADESEPAGSEPEEFESEEFGPEESEPEEFEAEETETEQFDSEESETEEFEAEEFAGPDEDAGETEAENNAEDGMTKAEAELEAMLATFEFGNDSEEDAAELEALFGEIEKERGHIEEDSSDGEPAAEAVDLEVTETPAEETEAKETEEPAFDEFSFDALEAELEAEAAPAEETSAPETEEPVFDEFSFDELEAELETELEAEAIPAEGIEEAEGIAEAEETSAPETEEPAFDEFAFDEFEAELEAELEADAIPAEEIEETEAPATGGYEGEGLSEEVPLAAAAAAVPFLAGAAIIPEQPEEAEEEPSEDALLFSEKEAEPAEEGIPEEETGFEEGDHLDIEPEPVSDESVILAQTAVTPENEEEDFEVFGETETILIATDETWLYYASDIENSRVDSYEVFNRLLWEEQDNLEKNVYVYDLEIPLIERYQVPIMIKEELPVKEVLQSREGEPILDFGRSFAGFVTFQSMLPKSACVRLTFADKIEDGYLVPENEEEGFIYVSDGVPEIVVPHFTCFEGRYVKVSGFEGILNPEDFTGCVLYADMEQTGFVETPDQTLNNIFEKMLSEQKRTSLIMPKDATARDVSAFAPASSYNMDTKGFLMAYLKDLREQHIQDKGADAARIIWNLYQMYGDEEILEENYELMKEWVEAIDAKDSEREEKEYLNNCGLEDEDWISVDDETEKEFLASALYYEAARIVKDAAVILGKEQDALKYHRLSGRIKQAFLEEYYTGSGRLAVDTQSAYVLALNSGLYVDRERVRKAFAFRLEKDRYRIRCGSAAAPYFCSVLAECGLERIAYDIVLDSEPKSFSNELQFIYAYAAGIRPIEPGFSMTKIAPLPDGRLRSLKCTYRSVSGTIISEWSVKDDGSLAFHFEIPDGVTAKISLPYYPVCAANGNEVTVKHGSYDYAYMPGVSLLDRTEE